MRIRLALLLVGALALASAPAPAAGQDDPGTPSLERVEELTRLGRTEEARALLMRWWDEGRPEASRRERQRALWIRGRLTVDPAQAALDFQRLALEYPGGEFSDRALLRLAQGAWAAGEEAALEAWMDRLARDYPDSPVVREARSWREAAGPVPGPPSSTGAVGTRAEEAEGEEARAGDAPAAEGADWAVQLGAFAGEGRARALRERVGRAGYAARLARVEGSRLLHVRVGRFASEAEARAVLEDIQALGLDATVVEDVQREREEP